MKLILSCFVLITLLLITGCKKSNTNQPDCVARNYGIYRLNFSSATVQHHVIISVGFYPLEKDFAAGVLSDTIQLGPGGYSVNITSHTPPGGGPAIDVEATGVTITQCAETVKDVAF